MAPRTKTTRPGAATPPKAAPERRPRATIYFDDPTTLRRLKIHCATTDQELSAFAERAIRTALDAADRRS